MTFSPAELRLLELSDRADSYRFRPHARRRGAPRGRAIQPLTADQHCAALELRAAGLSWTTIGNRMHVSHERLQRELGATPSHQPTAPTGSP